MRQKKSNLIYYIAAIAILSLIGLVAFTEINFETTHVEEIVK